MRLLPLCCLALLLGPPARAADVPATEDPVEALRQALDLPADNLAPSRVLSSATVLARQKRLAEHAGRVRAPADLCRALFLEDWKRPLAVFGRQTAEAARTARDQARRKLAAQAVAKLRHLLGKGDRPSRLAALALIAQSAQDEREWLRSHEQARFLADEPPFDVRPIFPQMIEEVSRVAAKDEDSAVRVAALRALAALRPEARALAAAFERELNGKEAVARRGAARLLAGQAGAKREHPEEEIPSRAGLPVFIALAGKFAADADAGVRQHCLTGLAHGAASLAEALRHIDLPSVQPGDDAKDIEQHRKQVDEAFAAWLSALVALEEALPAATRALADSDLAACLTGQRALENAATGRLVLRQWRQGGFKIKGKDPADLLAAPVKAVPELARSLAHKELRVRLGAIHVLETLAADAALAADALVKALGDDNRFVRWGAARALRNLAPAAAAKSVSALAKALSDDSADVRNVAAEALARCGRQAGGAVEALIRALQKGDEKLRPLAARALAAVGPAAKPAREALVGALGDELAAVRAGAALALGATGPLDEKTKEALVKALGEGGDVQRAAAAALLASVKAEPEEEKK